MRYLLSFLAAAAVLMAIAAPPSAASLLTLRAGPYFPQSSDHGGVWLDLGVDSPQIPGLVPLAGGFAVSADYLVGDGVDTLALTLNRRFSVPKIVPSLPGLYLSAGLGWYHVDAGALDDDGIGYRLAAGVELSKYTIEASYQAANVGSGLDPDGVGITLGLRF